MTVNPLEAKIAAPYARAMFDHGLSANLMHKVTCDLFNVSDVIDNAPDLKRYLRNPGISTAEKHEILERTVKSDINPESFLFIGVLVHRNRLDVLKAVAIHFSRLVYGSAGVILVDVVSAAPLGLFQRNKLNRKLQKLSVLEVRSTLYVDPSLIGGILIKTNYQVLDYTVKSKIKNIAKHLDTTIEI